MAAYHFCNPAIGPMGRYCGNEGPFQGRNSSLWIENSMDNFPLKTNNDSVSYWFVPVDITYPTPPYMSLREKVKRSQTLIVKRRKFMDTSYTILEVNILSRFLKKHVIKHRYSIRDTQDRWFRVKNWTSELMAMKLLNNQINLKAKFIISNMDMNKFVTLQIEGTNLYLSCQSGTIKLQPMTNEDSTNNQFLFFRQSTGNVTNSLQSATDPQLFLSTAAEGDRVPVTVQNNSQNSQNRQKFNINFELVDESETSLKAPQREEDFEYSRNQYSNNYDNYFSLEAQTPKPNFQRPIFCHR
ncbi:uncharacterized protein LOC142495814 [Ascaphus truei]|uniref:uncharacterized protein LOC142495814 n=1 Tax=Ascaphus truei TaxID=8439 RepID=UPI003F5A0481